MTKDPDSPENQPPDHEAGTDSSTSSNREQDDSEETDATHGSENDGTEQEIEESTSSLEDDSIAALMRMGMQDLLEHPDAWEKAVKERRDQQIRHAESRIGKCVGHYQIEELVGMGSMGSVYRAVDQNLGRNVALKFLEHGAARDQILQKRFKYEAFTLSSLDHPNIATIHDMDEDEAEGPYIVMAYYLGTPLSEYLKDESEDGRLPVEDAVKFAIEIGNALDTAHCAKIIHRDVKPSNIFICDTGSVRLLDFGVAKFENSGTLTGLGMNPGTPAYMSPEQEQGESVDGRSDLWSLGAVLFEMLTGKKPPRTENARPIERLLRQLRPDVDDALAQIVACCLDRERKRRYDSVARFLEDLEKRKQILTAEESKNGVPPFSPHGSSSSFGAGNTAGRRTRRRFRTLPMVLLGILFVGAGFSGFLHWQSREAAAGSGTLSSPTFFLEEDPAREEPVADLQSIAVLPFEILSDDEEVRDFAHGIHYDLRLQLERLAGLKVVARSSVLEYQGSDKTNQVIVDELNVATILGGEIRREGENIRVNVWLLDGATEKRLSGPTFSGILNPERAFDFQSEITAFTARNLKVKIRPANSRSFAAASAGNSKAYRFFSRADQLLMTLTSEPEHRYAEAHELLLKAIAADRGYALPWVRLSEMHLDIFRGDYNAAERLQPYQLEKAIDSARHAMIMDEEMADAYLALGRALFAARQYEEGKEAMSQVLRLAPGSLISISAHNHISTLEGKWDEQLKYLMELADRDRRNARTQFDAGYRASWMKQYEMAEHYYIRALIADMNHSHAHFRLAYLPFLREGDVSELQEYLSSQIATDWQKFRDDSGEYVESSPMGVYDRWLILLVQEDYDAAIEYLALQEGTYLNMTAYEYPVEFLQGWTYHLAGKTTEAERLMAKVIDGLTGKLSEKSESYRIRSPLAIAYAISGFKEDAIRESRRALQLKTEYQHLTPAFILLNHAWVYSLVGDIENAVDMIEQYLDGPSFESIESILRDPRSKPFREHPRIIQLRDEFRSRNL